MTWFKTVQQPAITSEQITATSIMPSGLKKLIASLNKREDREAVAGIYIRATSFPMKMYDAINDILNDGVYDNDLVDFGEWRGKLGLKIKTANDKLLTEKRIARMVSTVVQAYNLRHYGNSVLITVEDHKGRLIGVKTPVTPEERDAYLNKIAYRLKLATSRVERDNACFAALPENSSVKLAAFAATTGA